MKAFDRMSSWPAATKAASVVVGTDVTSDGAGSHRFHLASVTKPLFAYAALVAIEEGTLHLDQTIWEPGATVAHMLSHSSGLAPEQPAEGGAHTMAGLGSRRIYSNYGFEILSRALEASSGISTADYMHEAVFAPLGMTNTVLNGSPAHGAQSTVDDLARFAVELLQPSLIDPTTLGKATTPFLADIPGVLPGYGRQEPNPWGLGFELRGHKSPHWTGTMNSPETYGHFGRSGTFIWVDPAISAACVVLTDEDFGLWAVQAWPVFSDAVLNEIG